MTERDFQKNLRGIWIA